VAAGDEDDIVPRPLPGYLALRPSTATGSHVWQVQVPVKTLLRNSHYMLSASHVADRHHAPLLRLDRVRGNK
jgi:hypothetical protein